MAYLAFLWKARTIENCRLKYEKEKISSILATNTELPTNFYQKWTVYRTNSEKRIGQICNYWYPEGSKIATTCSNVKDNSSFLLRNMIGIVGGIVLLYFSYKIFVFELAAWSVMSWAIGVAITLGFIFNYRVRCLILLLIPGLFSRVGRYTLACYALVLILRGPATNTIKNLDILTECLACGQEQIKSSIGQMKESRGSSLNLMRETINATIEKIQYLATKMKEIMVKIHRLTMTIAHVLQASLSWLRSVEDACNKKLGTPYDYCIKMLTQETKNDEKELPEYSDVLKLDDVIKAVCFSLKSEDPLCIVGDFTKGSIVETVKNRLKTYSAGIQSLLSVGIRIRHSHSCCNGSAPVNQAPMGLVTELRSRADPILTWLSWSCTLTGLFLLLTILRAKYYQLMFRTRSRFDNRYITKELRELDLKRQRQGRDTVLPLNTRERVKYVSTASIRLLPSERTYLARSIVFMIITTFKLMIHMVADYSLYWVLMNMRSHGSTRDDRSTRSADISVQGSGPLAATVRMLLEALSMPLTLPSLSKSCLPNPHPPDLERYAQIGTLILSLWLLALFEPYGLRLRHLITGHYQPERAKARAVWLYYHIIRTRNCFLKHARRKLHREYKYTSEEKFTFKQWLNKCIPCLWLRKLLGVGPQEPRCLLCFTKHHPEEPERHLKTCESPSCPGVYCTRCFMDIGQLCTICYSPEDYGDFSDVSLERYTSDDSRNDNSDDDCEGDNKPLLGTSDFVIKEVESGHAKVNDNKKQKLKPKKNDNQETWPLLDSDCLNKYYTREKENRNNTPVVEKIKTNQQDCNKGFQGNSQLSPLYKETPFSRNLQMTIEGQRIPRKMLGAIIETMMLITAKINDSEYDENENTIETQSFTSSLVIERFKTQNISPDNAEESSKSFKTEISFLDVVLPKKIISSTTNFATVSNSKNSKQSVSHVHNDSQEKSKDKECSKGKINKRARKRNMKRYLELRKIITTRLAQRMRRRRIRFNKCRFSWKRRKRRYNNYSNLNVVKITSKAFTNKTTVNERSELIDEFYEINNTITNQISSDTLRPGKSIQQDTNSCANNKMIVMRAAEWYSKNDTYNLSSVASVNTNDLPVVNASRLSNDYKGIYSIKARTKMGPIIRYDINQGNSRKHGFWANLRIKIIDKKSCPCNGKSKNVLLRNFFWNHRRKKKLKLVNSVQLNKANLEKKVNDEARQYRLSMFLQDQNWLRNLIKNKDTVGNNEIFLGPDIDIRENVPRETIHLKIEETKNARKINSKHANHGMQLKRKSNLAIDKQQDMKNGDVSLDQKKYANKPADKNNSFTKMLKKISKTGLNLPKLHEVTRPLNIFFNEPQCQISCTSTVLSGAQYNYNNSSFDEYKKETDTTIEELKRDIFEYEQFTLSDYHDNISTDSKFKVMTSVNCRGKHKTVFKDKQKEHRYCQTDGNRDDIKRDNYQAASKSQKATNNRGTNIPTLDELVKNSKEVQINLSKYNEVTQTLVSYKPGPNVSPLLHYNAIMFDKACCECEDTGNDIQRRPSEQISITSKVPQEEQNFKRYERYNDIDRYRNNKRDTEKGENKNENRNRVIQGGIDYKHSLDKTCDLSLELTIQDSTVTSCDCEHVWQLVPNKDVKRRQNKTSHTTLENTTGSIDTLEPSKSDLIKNSKKMKFQTPQNKERIKLSITPKTSYENNNAEKQRRQTDNIKHNGLNKICECKPEEITGARLKRTPKVSDHPKENEMNISKGNERFKLLPKNSPKHERKVGPKKDGLYQIEGTDNSNNSESNNCCVCKPLTAENRSSETSLNDFEFRSKHEVCEYKDGFDSSRMNLSDCDITNRDEEKGMDKIQCQCQTEGSSIGKKSSKLRRWFQAKWPGSSSTKLYKNTKKPAKPYSPTQDLQTQTKTRIVEHTGTQCCSSRTVWRHIDTETKQVSTRPAELSRNRNLETQTHVTQLKHTETQYCRCPDCRCCCEDREQQTEKTKMADFGSQFPEPAVREHPKVVTRTEDRSTVIEYNDEKRAFSKRMHNKTTTQHMNAKTCTHWTTESETGTDLTTTTTSYDWWSPIVDRKSEKADPEESGSWQSEWSYAKFKG